MKIFLKNLILERIRKPENNFYKYLRLNRAEFGHTFKSKKKKSDNYNYYPNIFPLIKNLSNHLKIKKENLLVGLGAESIIRDIFSLLCKSRKRFGMLVPNYFMYSLYSKYYRFKTFSLNINPEKTNELTVDVLKNFIKKKKIDLFLLVNPSHPFEKNWTHQEIKKIITFCQKRGVIIIIDEVYQGLGSKTSISLIKKYENLIIIGSLSKNFGLPGVRVGYMVSSKKIIRAFESFRLAIELPSESIKTASQFITNKKKIVSVKNKICSARDFAHKQFKKRKITAFGKYGNTITFKVRDNLIAKKIGNYLKNNKILINYNYPKPFDNFLNLTTTNIKNLKYFFSNLDKIDY